MKYSHLVASIMTAAMVVSPLAYGVPGQGTQVTNFRNISIGSEGSFEDTENQKWYYFHANVFDDKSGLRGEIAVSVLDNTTFQMSFISCSGPAYAKIVSVNQGTGSTSISAILDPLDASCSSLNVDVSKRVKVTLVGRFDGNERLSLNGTGKETSGGVNSKYNFKIDTFSEAFTGTNGFYSGTFSGQASTQKRTDRQQVK